jgi:deazaflavin-dependent oxidoreductase (nitroreductase family)
MVLIASNGGAPAHPPWYLNLKADPAVEVQIKGERFKSRARDATPEERPELWRTMAGYYPPYDEYQRRTEREIPVIVLERVDYRAGCGSAACRAQPSRGGARSRLSLCARRSSGGVECMRKRDWAFGR